MKTQGTANRGQGTGDQRPGTWWKRWAGLACVLLAAGLAVAPELLRGVSCGHDFDFHLVSWIDALQSWRDGILYPLWTPSPNFDAGEPRFIFYPPLTWMLGAALGAVLPWKLVPAALTFLLLAATGLATRALGRQALPNAPATLAGCIAIFSGYTLFTIYERSAFAELAGGCWIPLMLLLVLRKDERDEDWRRWIGRPAVLLGLVIAGAWLSNAPVGVMACYLLAGFALVVAVLRWSWTPVLHAAAGAVLGLGLAAFYLLPAAREQSWVEIHQVTDDPGERIENSFLFGHHADPQLALHDAELHRVSWIAVVMAVATLAALVVCRRRRTLPGGRGWWIPLALVPVGIVVLQLPLSLPVWNALPKLRFLQFPWRWLVALEAPLGIFVAAAVQASARRWRGVVLPASGIVFLGLSVFAGRLFFQLCDQYDAVPGMLEAYRDGQGFAGTDEYAPVGADNSLVAQNLPAGCLVTDPLTVLGRPTADDPQPQWSAGRRSCVAAFGLWNRRGGAPELHRRIEATMPEAGYLVLRLRRYPAWDVRVNGQPLQRYPEREDGLIVVPVAAGPQTVTADWIETPDVAVGRHASLASLALVIGLAGIAWRRTRAQLK